MPIADPLAQPIIEALERSGVDYVMRDGSTGAEFHLIDFDVGISAQAMDLSQSLGPPDRIIVQVELAVIMLANALCQLR